MEMMKKKGRCNIERVMMLMRECAPNRMNWIKEIEPAVSEILDVYPALRDNKIVRMSLISNLYMHN